MLKCGVGLFLNVTMLIFQFLKAKGKLLPNLRTAETRAA
jgi:hypothetical protein